jgi:hypothetical protein
VPFEGLDSNYGDGARSDASRLPERLLGLERISTQKAQILSGFLEDPAGATLPGIVVELLSGKRLVQSLRTNNRGAYDFGQIQPGKYRIRIRDRDGFCAPKIRCAATGCIVNPRLRPNPKNMVMVD